MSLLTKLLALTASAVRAQTVNQCKFVDGHYKLGEFLNYYIDLLGRCYRGYHIKVYHLVIG